MKHCVVPDLSLLKPRYRKSRESIRESLRESLCYTPVFTSPNLVCVQPQMIDAAELLPLLLALHVISSYEYRYVGALAD